MYGLRIITILNDIKNSFTRFPVSRFHRFRCDVCRDVCIQVDSKVMNSNIRKHRCVANMCRTRWTLPMTSGRCTTEVQSWQD